jgi:hypothetical protein
MDAAATTARKSMSIGQRSPAVGPQNQTNEQASRRRTTNNFCQDLYAADRSAQACSSDWVNISAD